MQIDLRMVSIKPLRNTFDHIAKRLGSDKPASRYMEGTMDLQAVTNFHYRPLWDPKHTIFDAGRTAIGMKDWYALKDPRQFYYGTYTMARAKMQEASEENFNFVEERGLAERLPNAVRDLALQVYVPLRHVEWGANMNNMSICAYGYGTAITQACNYHGMDRLGNAQYLTRLGLVLGDVETIQVAKKDWLEGAMWQELRHFVEDTFVVSDWFELFVATNFVLDGLMYPLVYQHIDRVIDERGGPAVSLMTRFQTAWFDETTRWVDSCIKVAAAESPANKEKVSSWINAYRNRALKSLAPIAKHALGANSTAIMESIELALNARAAKCGI